MRQLWTIFAILFTAIIAVNIIFIWYSPSEIVAWIGVENAYLVVFVIATLGGLSSVTSGVLYATLLTFAAGGASPWLLGLATGVGIGIGDTIVFTMFRTGLTALYEAEHSVAKRLTRWRELAARIPRRLQYLLVYGYLSFTPFPNDIILFVMASLRFSYVIAVPMLFVGAITLATLLAFFGEQLPVWFG